MLKIELPYDPDISFLGIFLFKKKSVNKILKKYLYTHVHRNTSYNSQEAGAT